MEDCGEGSSITVPKEGWYSFFLAYTGSTTLKLVATTSTQHPKDADKEQTKTIALPFSHLGETLVDSAVGMIVYLPEAATVSVTREADATVTREANAIKRKEPDLLDFPASNDETEEEVDTEKPLKWSLVFRQTYRASESHKDALLSTLPKCLVCRACLRSFATWHALDNHCISAQHPRRRQVGPNNTSTQVYQQPLTVLHQDDAMGIVVKPQGLPVQGASPCLLRSPLLSDCLFVSSAPDALRKPRPVHRLDSPTGGVLVVAKTRTAESKLRLSFAERDCHKRYRAIVTGCLQHDTGRVEELVQGKEAVTTYKVVQRIGATIATLVDLWPVTGRFHQLRRHMKSLGHPMVGDKRYGRVDTSLPHHDRLSLFAMEITLPHPVTGKSITCQMEDPKWLTFVVDCLNKQSNNSTGSASAS